MTELDVLLTAAEAAELLGVQRTNVHHYVKQGQLLGFLLPTKGEVRPGRLYIPRGEVLALKERREGRRAAEWSAVSGGGPGGGRALLRRANPRGAAFGTAVRGRPLLRG